MSVIENRAARDILEDRARRLARVAGNRRQESLIDAVAFDLGEERYAVETVFVREILSPPVMVPLPGVPSFILGIVNVRSTILSVLDLKAVLGLARTTLDERARLLVLTWRQMTFAVIVDRLRGIVGIPSKDLQPPPATLDSPEKHYIRAVTHDRLILLAADELLSDPKLVVD